MYAQFLKFVDRHQLFKNDQKILLAVSGGIDSMVMVNLFIKASIDVAFAHCNFGLRGEESDADEKFVRLIADKHNIPIYIEKPDTRYYAAKNKLSIQMAARELRYTWFDHLVQISGFQLYATAHHFDDQMETFFINLLRGTGISGLGGIPVKNGNCIRPLLFADREMINNWAQSNGIEYREDSSNKTDNYLRNKIRHRVLPGLKEARESYKSGFEQTMNAMNLTDKFIGRQIARIKSEIMHQLDDHILIDLDKLTQLEDQTFVLFELLQPFNFNFSTVSNIISGLGKTSGKRFLSETHELIIDRKFLILIDIKPRKDLLIKIQSDTSKINAPLNLRFSTFEYTGQPFPNIPHIAWLDYDKLKFPLEIRNFRSGDYFHPLGMQGHKKLSDFFIDEKLSILQKRSTYVLVSGNEIAWVIGQRIDNRFKITGQTSTIYAVEVILKPL